MTLLDRTTNRLVGIGFYDTEESIHKADEIMNQGPPESMPDELRSALPNRSFVGLFEVVDTDGVQVAP